MIDPYLEGILNRREVTANPVWKDRPVTPEVPAKGIEFAYYGCHDDNTPGDRGDLFRFVGIVNCADGIEAKARAKRVMPLGYVGYVVIVANGLSDGHTERLVSGVHVDNRRRDRS